MDPTAHSEIPKRIEAVTEAYRQCRICPRDCGVNRLIGQEGYCGLGREARCFREMLHPSEEAELSPSHQVYFSGCNLRCEYCSVMEWNLRPKEAEPLDRAVLIRAVHDRRAEGAKNLNLLGGEPAVNILGILELLADLPPDICVVWNSGMYYEPEVGRWLDGLVDVTLADLKCGNSDCARRILGAEDYVPVARDNILAAAAGSGEVIVRHLLMPGHEICCFNATVAWLAAHAPGVKFSLRADYIPPVPAKSAPRGYVKPIEIREARALCHDLGLNCIT